MDRYLTLLCLAPILYTIYRCFTGTSLSRVRGPKPTSFLFGNLPELYQGQAGEADFRWQRLYGDVIRVKGILGVSMLLGDMAFVLTFVLGCRRINLWLLIRKLCHGFLPLPRIISQSHLERRVQSLILNGKSVVWAEGDIHKRQRKILNPGFGGAESRAFLVISQASAERLSMTWSETIEANNGDKVVLDIPSWISRATLDAIAEAAFDIRLGCLRNSDNALAKSYNGMLMNVYGTPSSIQIFIQEALKYIPTSILTYWAKHSSNRRVVRIRETRKVATAIAESMVKEKAEFLLQGKGGRDIFTLLGEYDMRKHKLSDEELYSQMRIILIAGQESTSHTINWTLLELARKPEIQSRLRSEITQHESAIHARGDTQFTASDLDNMLYLNAIIKEALRYHCAAAQVFRVASQDCILPLSRPITTESGELMYEVLVPKGTRIIASVAAYNRNKDMWGEDADVFNPGRWLDGIAKDKKEAATGVYSSLLTFGGGHRACLGWRFAVIEIQAFLVEIVRKFEISLTEKARRIRRESCLVMVPTVEGEVTRGVQLPLAISITPRNRDE
ncbi:cytochrome P450 [Pisolithus orientalis]|uniref:cytochrome P450 n=1 Tax=Pisolithus orientalis TaxID=936130 RepID=UPI0022245CCC|nr:cytochrome P450 [Pisolithus orientalis]KAI5995261.1 cytochrome P450 [Pisolithus orientalis]